MRSAHVVNRRIARSIASIDKGCHIILQEPVFNYEDDLPLPGWHAALVIKCHDICKPTSTPTTSYVHFTPEMAELLIAFLDKNVGRSMLINCDAGLSRSVAVGCILRDFYKYKVHFVVAKDDSFRNSLIYNTCANILSNRGG